MAIPLSSKMTVTVPTTPTEAAVAIAIAKNKTISLDEIAATCEISQRHAARMVASLRSKGLLVAANNLGGRHHKTTYQHYMLHIENTEIQAQPNTKTLTFLRENSDIFGRNSDINSDMSGAATKIPAPQIAPNRHIGKMAAKVMELRRQAPSSTVDVDDVLARARARMYAVDLLPQQDHSDHSSLGSDQRDQIKRSVVTEPERSARTHEGILVALRSASGIVGQTEALSCIVNDFAALFLSRGFDIVAKTVEYRNKFLERNPGGFFGVKNLRNWMEYDARMIQQQSPISVLS